MSLQGRAVWMRLADVNERFRLSEPDTVVPAAHADDVGAVPTANGVLSPAGDHEITSGTERDGVIPGPQYDHIPAISRDDCALAVAQNDTILAVAEPDCVNAVAEMDRNAVAGQVGGRDRGVAVSTLNHVIAGP